MFLAEANKGCLYAQCWAYILLRNDTFHFDIGKLMTTILLGKASLFFIDHIWTFGTSLSYKANGVEFVIKNISRYQDSKTNMNNIYRGINNLGSIRKKNLPAAWREEKRSQGHAMKMSLKKLLQKDFMEEQIFRKYHNKRIFQNPCWSIFITQHSSYKS